MVPSLPSHLGLQLVSVKLFLSGFFTAKGATQYKQQIRARPMGKAFPPNWWGEFIHSSDFKKTTRSLSFSTTHPLMFKSILKDWTEHCRTDFLASLFCNSRVKTPNIHLLTLTNLLGSTTVRKTVCRKKTEHQELTQISPPHTPQTRLFPNPHLLPGREQCCSRWSPPPLPSHPLVPLPRPIIVLIFVTGQWSVI